MSVTVEEQIYQLILVINKLKEAGLDPTKYYNPADNVVYDLVAILEQLQRRNATITTSTIFPEFEFPKIYLSTPSIAVGVRIIPDPAREAHVRASIAELKRIITNMEAKGLSPRQLYDIKNDKVIDLIAILESYKASPQFMV